MKITIKYRIIKIIKINVIIKIITIIISKTVKFKIMRFLIMKTINLLKIIKTLLTNKLQN